MANLDPTSWYQIYLGDDTATTIVGTYLVFSDDESGAVFFQGTKEPSPGPEQIWQVFPYNTTYYVLRTQASGANGYLHASLSVNETTPGRTVPDMLRADQQDDSMFWRIDPWGDGTFFLTNAANGSDWHLNIKDNALMTMDSNITKPQLGQRFSFATVGQIDNANYSSVVVSDRWVS